MISEVHYSDETLIAMLEAGDEEAINRNQHLASCQTCRDGLEQYRAIVDTLGCQAAWDYRELKSDPDPATVANLRAFANSMEREDEEAETYVAALLEGARETWMPRLRAHPEWRTAGVVRKLVADAYTALTKLPLDGVEMTSLAIEIADHLVEEVYPKDTVARLRGHAWREHAYGLFYVGEFKQSLVACDRADAELSRCMVDEYDKARVAVVRALSLRPLDDVATGSSLTKGALHVFSNFGDTERLVAAAVAAAHMQFKVSDYKAALDLLVPIAAVHGDSLGTSARSILEGNLGHCYRQLGDIDSSICHYQIASALMAEIGSVTESLRVQWNVAMLLAGTGRTDEALVKLANIRAEFGRRNMSSEDCVVGLEMAELLIVQDRFNEAEALCVDVCRHLQDSGLGTTSRAMTAVAFLQEAVRSRRATRSLVRHVHEYVRRLPEEPNLLFAPPLL